MRKHLERVWKVTGKKPAQLLAIDKNPLPEEFTYIYQWFAEFYSGQPFSYGELDAWSRLTHRQLDVVEIEIIRRLCLARERL